MKRKGFTLVELLAVIAILAILVIIALPNVLKMYNNAKKNTFLVEVKSLSKDVSNKYVESRTKGKRIKTVSNKKNSLELSGRDIKYYFKLDSSGNLSSIYVSDGTYCVSSTKDYSKLTIDDISEDCKYVETAGTLTNEFYELSGETDRGLVSSISFYSDNRKIDGATGIDVSEEKDNSVMMYLVKNSENLYDISIVSNGIVAFPENSRLLFSFSTNFEGSNLKEINFNNSIDTFNVTDMSSMFEYDDKLTSIDLSGFNTVNVDTMSCMFRCCSIKSIDVSSFNTSNVTIMDGMFSHGYPFNSSVYELSITGLNKFDTSKVTDMSGMFHDVKTDKLDLSSFDFSNVEDVSGMFDSTELSETLDLSNNKFSSLKYPYSMFYNYNGPQINLSNSTLFNSATSLFWKSNVGVIDLTNCDTSKVTDMSEMFYESSVKEIKGLETLDTSNAIYMNFMFAYTRNLTSVDVSKFNTSKVTNMYCMFKETVATDIDTSNFDFTNVTNATNKDLYCLPR